MERLLTTHEVAEILGVSARTIRRLVASGQLRVRFQILRRDGFRCRYCGASPSDGIRLVVDHIVPVADGGTDDWDNLAAACHECNAGKGRHPLIRPKTETQ